MSTILTDDERPKLPELGPEWTDYWRKTVEQKMEAYADAREAAVLAKLARQEPVAMRYDFDGYGYRYIDSGSGSDWRSRIPDAEAVYAAPLPAVVQKAVAWVPVHPRTGPLWAMTTDAPDPERLPTYPLRPLYGDPLPAVVQVPDGWKLVPVEPTCDMLAAMSGEWHPSRHGKAREQYAAMLAAAPEAPAQEKSNG